MVFCTIKTISEFTNMEQKAEDFGFIGIIVAITLIFLFFILGLKGLITGIGVIIFLVIPFYLILDSFSLENDEKLVFSFFLGAGIFGSIAYWIGYFISFRIAIFVTLILLLLVVFFVKKFSEKKQVASN